MGGEQHQSRRRFVRLAAGSAGLAGSGALGVLLTRAAVEPRRSAGCSTTVKGAVTIGAQIASPKPDDRRRLGGLIHEYRRVV
jgi:hypothetical protein